jgi:hypothetical protein
VALADSGRAIGAVTRLLSDQLRLRGFEVSVGKPEDAALNNAEAKLNLFLYETAFDPHLRNTSLRDAEPPPLWMVLKYLLTAYEADSSDSVAAHELLGRGLAALQSLSVLRLDTVDAGVRAALGDNPEPLKLTFDDSGVELLSRVMQGSEEHYRLSAAFQVRPVMIAPDRADRRSALLVGIDYTTAPSTVIGADGVHIGVLPTLGPTLDRAEPARFEAGASIELFGTELGGADLEVVLGDQMLTVTARRPDRLVVVVEGELDANGDGPIASGTAMSAGELPLIVRRRLSPTRTRSSNLLAARLLPTVESASLAGADLVMTGLLLGNETDDVVVALYREADGVTVRMLDTATTIATQKTLTVSGATTGLAAGSYFVILSVNSQQARSSPRVVVP